MIRYDCDRCRTSATAPEANGWRALHQNPLHGSGKGPLTIECTFHLCGPCGEEFTYFLHNRPVAQAVIAR